MLTQKFGKKINYYLGASYRRKKLDKLQEKYKHIYHGDVLDIGGRDRGNFKKPKDRANKWIFADIEEKHHPDIVLNVSNMKNIGNETYDVVSAIELFEHVKNPEKGLSECYRVLKRDGALIISAPFLFCIHADPYDYQRWTKHKWKETLENIGFQIKYLESVGGYFTVLADTLKILNKSLPKFLNFFGFLFYPLFDIIVKLDNIKMVKKNKLLNNFTTGYFIIADKKINA